MEEGNKVKLFSKLIDRIPVLLILLGVILFALGLAGGVTFNSWFPISDLWARIVAAVAGVFIFGLGISSWRTQGNSRTHGDVPKAQNYGIKIVYPKAGGEVSIVDVSGTIKKAPPEGYTLKIFKIFPRSESYAEIGSGRIAIDQGTWEAKQCNIGGKAKPGDERFIGAFLVGPGGAVLLDYHTQAAREHKAQINQLRDSTDKKDYYLPLLEERTPDMVECDRVLVRREMS